jgi:hypothetical protein
MTDRSKRLEHIQNSEGKIGWMDIEWLISEIRSLERKLEIAKEALMNHIPPNGQAFALNTFYDGYLAREALAEIEGE